MKGTVKEDGGGCLVPKIRSHQVCLNNDAWTQKSAVNNVTLRLNTAARLCLKD